MKYTDKIIKYLSGDLEQDEVRQFEQLRTTDPELENEFQSIRKIWEITRENLMLEDLPEEKIRDQLIAEVLAHHDISQYRGPTGSKQSENFRKALEKAEESLSSPGIQPSKGSSRFNAMTIILAAASLALLFLVIRPSTNLKELAVAYYDPSESELASDHAVKTRGNEARAMQFFRDGNYEAARYYFEVDTAALEKDPLARLFYGISCLETGDREQAVSTLASIATSEVSDHAGTGMGTDTTALAAYHAKWYLSLIFVREGNTESAIPLLVDLSRSEGPYGKYSTRLLRKIE